MKGGWGEEFISFICTEKDNMEQSVDVYKELKSAGPLTIDSSLREQLDAVLKEEGNKLVFRQTRDEIKSKLQDIGILIDKLLLECALPECTAYQTLCKVFTQQYR